MFRTLQNTAKLQLTLVPDGPIVVRAQSVGIDPGVADMEFQRTRRNGRSTVFLAGSGLKGVLRSHSERILRSAKRFACDPTQVRESCGGRRDREGQDTVYQYPHDGNCPACFTFGSLKLSGRFRIGDAYPKAGDEEITNLTEVRTGVGIERKSQAASTGVLYDTEVVVAGSFEAKIHGESFSLWQLGLVLAALQDLDSGLVRIGGGKARGMGSVRVKDLKLELGFLGNGAGKITGAQREGKENPYHLPANDAIDEPPGGEADRLGLFQIRRFTGKPLQDLTDALITGPLQRYLEGKA
jgi:CRISPR-associated RAMP protein (TIGR02581 family)